MHSASAQDVHGYPPVDLVSRTKCSSKSLAQHSATTKFSSKKGWLSIENYGNNQHRKQSETYASKSKKLHKQEFIQKSFLKSLSQKGNCKNISHGMTYYK
jgi:hypothetical protein